jgi:hypothetical protein
MEYDACSFKRVKFRVKLIARGATNFLFIKSKRGSDASAWACSVVNTGTSKSENSIYNYIINISYIIRLLHSK